MPEQPEPIARVIDVLAREGARLARESHPELDETEIQRVETWIAGAIEVQMTDPDYEQAYMVQLPAPPDVVGEMPDPTVELCGACVDAYRNGIEPGGTACENVAPGWFGHYG